MKLRKEPGYSTAILGSTFVLRSSILIFQNDSFDLYRLVGVVFVQKVVIFCPEGPTGKTIPVHVYGVDDNKNSHKHTTKKYRRLQTEDKFKKIQTMIRRSIHQYL